MDIPAEEDSVSPPNTLGPIRNPYVRRRERRVTSAKSAPISRQASVKPAPTKIEPAIKDKEEPKADQKPASKEPTSATSVPSGAKKSVPKRGATGGIMQSFAKAASKPKSSTASQPSVPSLTNESSMQALSDDGEDDSVALPQPEQENETARKNRKDRQDKLKRMMEESSEDEEPEKEDTPMEEPEDEAPIPEVEKKEDEPVEVISSTGDGRRRGKRRIMKKKTAMDDQGYLGKSYVFLQGVASSNTYSVTVQEPGWESFSEDEPAPPAKKKAEITSQPAKPKKAAPKGQGNIMSFFGKK